MIDGALIPAADHLHRRRGSSGVRDAAWEEAANISIGVICPRAQVKPAPSHLHGRYYAGYAMAAFLQDAGILSHGKLRSCAN